ncbi:MAG: TatD family hydrolase [Thiobacillaceae bacterium]
MYIDTHCHLDAPEYDVDRDRVASIAHQSGVDIVVPSIGRFNFDSVKETNVRYPGCYAAYGMHPMYINVHRPEDIDELRAWVEREKPVAIGEIGLDLFQTRIDRPGIEQAEFDLQEHFFKEQLKVARDYGLPVLLHTRRANDQILKNLRRISTKGGIAHAFNGSMHQAQEFIKLGFKLGFGGAFTWPRASNLQMLAKELPLESIVLETDGPDIPPVWLGKARNSPVELPRIALTLAELRGISLDKVAQQTTLNARDLLSLPPCDNALQ